MKKKTKKNNELGSPGRTIAVIFFEGRPTVTVPMVSIICIAYFLEPVKHESFLSKKPAIRHSK